jgi:hypothetical protein
LKRGLLARRITVAASTVDPAPVTRRFTVAMAVDLARLAWDTVL